MSDTNTKTIWIESRPTVLGNREEEENSGLILHKTRIFPLSRRCFKKKWRLLSQFIFSCKDGNDRSRKICSNPKGWQSPPYCWRKSKSYAMRSLSQFVSIIDMIFIRIWFYQIFQRKYNESYSSSDGTYFYPMAANEGFVSVDI